MLPTEKNVTLDHRRSTIEHRRSATLLARVRKRV